MGGINHVKCVLSLLKTSHLKGYDYYHITSGNTYPIKNYNETDSFFKKHNGNSFIEMNTIKENGSFEARAKYYYFYDLINRKGKIGSKISWLIYLLQYKLGISRKLKFSHYGYFYCHLTYDFVSNVFEYLDSNKKFLKELSTVAIPEEFFFQFFANNNESECQIVDNCLIYSDWWNSSMFGSPMNLNINDVDSIMMDSDIFWCRKIRDLDTAKYIISKIT